ncbi:MAG: hypothetical protein IT211_11770 [Armatimonadetes bacterium]|nr:hypothetical protein [Armatimonadota bacterium]
MTWGTLTTTAVTFGAEQPHLQRIFATAQYAGDSWESLFLTEAKHEIERDFRRVLRLDVGTAEDLASIDTIVDSHVADFRDLLAMKQMELAFAATDGGMDSLNRQKKIKYEGEYKLLLQRLPGLFQATGTSQAGSYRIRL